MVIAAALTACGTPPGQAKALEKKTAAAAVGFEQTPQPPPPPGPGPENWCYARYGPSLVVGAESLNTNRRYFFLEPGITKLVVGPSSSTATFLLEPLAGGKVRLFTGANYPECLSSPANLILGDEGSRFRYQNRQGVDFQLEVQVDGTLVKITVEFQPGLAFAMSVNRCLECK